LTALYFAALVISAFELAMMFIHLYKTNGLQEPMAVAFNNKNDDSSLIKYLQDYITYGDSINMQEIYDQVMNGMTIVQ
jgi:hypothetical protein